MAQRSQSAMEYLMTYGWAIIAVAVALGVLYSLGVFGAGTNGGSGCSVIAGFSCTKPLLFSSGILTLGFGQIGGTKTITATGCSQNTTSPANWLSSGATLQSGQVANLTFSCFDGSQSGKLGSIFSGTLWVQYTVSGGSGQTITQEVGTVKIPITNSGSPIGSVAWVVDNSGVITIINTTTNKVVNTINIGGTLTDIAFNPSGTIAYITTYGSTIDMVSTATDSVTGTISVTGGCTDMEGIAINPAGTVAYTACDTLAGNLGIVSLVSNTATTYALPALGGDSDHPNNVAFNPNGTFAYVAANGNPVGAMVYVTAATNTVNVGISVGSAGYTTGAYDVAFSPSGSIAYFTSGKGFGYVNVPTATPYLPYQSTTAGLTGIAVNPSGSLTYVTTGIGNSDNAIPINTATYTAGSNVVIGLGGTYGVSFNPSGTYVYVVNDASPGSVSVINPQNGNIVATISNVGSYPNSIAFVPR